MSTESRLEAWKRECNKEEVVNWFVKGERFKVGIDNGCTVNQLMNDLKFRNPQNDQFFETFAKMHLRSCMDMARRSFQRDGFILASKKMKKGTPTVYFLIDNYGEERIARHYELKGRAERGVRRFRNDKLTLLELTDKVKEPKVKELFKKAYSTRLNLDQNLIGVKGKKKELAAK